MPLRLYNTLTRSIEPFKPIEPPRVTFYACGPTVYDYAHIGNFRSFLAADVLRRFLEYSGFTVRQIMNMTDVGHMVDDSVADGSGEDKLDVARRRLLQSKKEGTLPPGVDLDPDDPNAIASFYANAFLQDARRLGLKVAIEQQADPTLMPRPTQFVEPMIKLIQSLISEDHAYVASDGVVYFDVQSFPDYGALSGNTLDKLRAGAGGRVTDQAQSVKKHPADFMLWKPDPTHLMRWPSPWGEGYPGWHLECSAMALALLTEQGTGEIDLHSGGEDNIFPHHECEVAQSRCATGCAHFARYWFHPRHLFVDGGKMSKSKGTFYTLNDITAQGYSPAALRLELIKTHYRTNANFTLQGLRDSERRIERWRTFRDRAVQSTSAPRGQSIQDEVADQFQSALDDDLNIAGALGAIDKWIGQISEPSRADADLLDRFDTVLGVLDLEGAADVSIRDDSVDAVAVESLLTQRTQARKDRDFARADAIRDELDALGIEIKDGPEGTTWTIRPRRQNVSQT